MIRRLTVLDVTTAARSLAAAFHDDPHMRWVFRDERRRPAQLEQLYLQLIERLWLPHSASFIAADGTGAALWMNQGARPLDSLAELRLLPAMARIAGGASARGLRALACMERHHPRAPHWYLPIVGVAPEGQGRGLGTALMRPMLDRCDAEGLPAYLEASSERSRALYERLGFVVTDEVTYAKDGPPLWLMWREAPASRSSR